MKKLFSFVAVALSVYSANAQQAAYDLPATLSYYGTITPEEGVPFPAANFVTTNPINDGAWIWVPVGSKVFFKNTSSEGATAYRWTVPGADDADTDDLVAVYSTAGTFDFPTLTAEYESGEQTFTHDLKIKVGGVAELCHSDTRSWADTYGLGFASYGDKNGALGGSNNRDIVGVGNFYKFSSGEMYVDAVNIYAVNKPLKAAADANIRVRVYLPYIMDYMVMTAVGPLEGDNILMSDYKTRDDGVYSPIKDYAVYSLDFVKPLYCEGYPYLFFAVEGFVSTPDKNVTEDFVIATDVMPSRSLTFEEYNDALCHNSFVRLNGESDYSRPVSVVGGFGTDGFSGKMKSFSFWICPKVRGSETPAGIEDVVAASGKSEITITRDGDYLTVSGLNDGLVSVVSVNGVRHLSAEAANGGAVFNVSSLPKGVYIIATADGKSAKFAK